MTHLSREKALPDIIYSELKVLFVGYNPGMYSAEIGHHYANKSNSFWKLLFEAGLTPFRLQAVEDNRLLDFGFGSTNIVDRPSKSASDISTQEFKDGAKALEQLINNYQPKIVCYVGIGVYRAFASYILSIPASRVTVKTGKQENHLITGIIDFVCSNPSGLNTIPYGEQLACFKALKLLIECY